MCYDIKASLEAQLKGAKYKGDEEAVNQIKEKLVPFTDLPLFHASGFSHPKLLIYTDEHSHIPKVATWGLIPPWVKSEEQKFKIWNSTILARGESIFEKPSYKDSAINKRCIIYVDGFYEHHHFNKKTYPFLIQNKDKSPMALAGLWTEWQRADGHKLNSFSIVTTKGNKLMTKIHNNPKITEARMPLILVPELIEKWLTPITDKADQDLLNSLILPYPDDKLKAHTVNKLRGKQYLGNVAEISEEIIYEGLVFEN